MKESKSQSFVFQQFGDIEGLQEEESPLSVVLTFKSRSEAENVCNMLSIFKECSTTPYPVF